uniref:Putative secreted protein n=1 Tax=Anopheles triannulatus TaxID=58253 RepID=A0A2M4B3D6_9DIPT
MIFTVWKVCCVRPSLASIRLAITLIRSDLGDVLGFAKNWQQRSGDRTRRAGVCVWVLRVFRRATAVRRWPRQASR